LSGSVFFDPSPVGILVNGSQGLDNGTPGKLDITPAYASKYRVKAGGWTIIGNHKLPCLISYFQYVIFKLISIPIHVLSITNYKLRRNLEVVSQVLPEGNWNRQTSYSLLQTIIYSKMVLILMPTL